MLQRGDLVPHFTVTRLDGTPVRYATVWQRRSLVLVVLPRAAGHGEAERYAASLATHAAQLTGAGAELVITADLVAGAPCPGVVVADRWGEIYLVAASRSAADLPGADALAEWLEHIRHECPECQGEAR